MIIISIIIITCNNIQFSLWPSIHSHTPCTHSTNSLTFLHTLIHIHNHTQDKRSEYWIFKIQSDLKKIEVKFGGLILTVAWWEYTCLVSRTDHAPSLSLDAVDSAMYCIQSQLVPLTCFSSLYTWQQNVDLNNSVTSFLPLKIFLCKKKYYTEQNLNCIICFCLKDYTIYRITVR